MDCTEGMGQFPDNYFDFGLIDTPWGNYDIKKNSKCKMFDNIEPKKEYWQELGRVTKHLVVFGINYLNNVKFNGGRIIWNKLGRHIGRRKQAPTISDAEIAYQSFNNLVKMFSYAWIGNVTGYNYGINTTEFKNRIHPTQKPIALYSWILKEYGQAGWKILDTHVGSGSSLIACEKEGFQYVGFEIDPDYYKAAKERIERERMQLTLALQ